jgi:hypothetical protein
VCHRHDAAIAASEQIHGGTWLSASDIAAIQSEVHALQRLEGAAPLHVSFDEVNRGIAASLNASAGPSYDGDVQANEHLHAAREAAARLGVRCSFGARA